MCIITDKFIAEVKNDMGAIGFKPTTDNEFTLNNLQSTFVERVFRLKEPAEAFSLAFHYRRIVCRWKKILKAKSKTLWNGFDYGKSYIKINKNPYTNVMFSTNLFGNKYDVFYLDENHNVMHELITKSSGNKELKILKFEDNFCAVFEKSYLKEVPDKDYVDITMALATIQTIKLYADKNKFLSYVIINEENVEKSALIKNVNGEISKAIMRIAIINALNAVPIVSAVNYVNVIKRF